VHAPLLRTTPSNQLVARPNAGLWLVGGTSVVANITAIY